VKAATDPIRAYDALAATYDDLYHRPIDAAEDRLLGRVLRPLVAGRSVVDLACGTGLLLDIGAEPSSYLGVDGAPRMLERLRVKHPSASTRLADLRQRAEWLPEERVDVVTCLFAASYLDPARWLGLAVSLLRQGGLLFLHGYTARYRHRQHYALHGACTPEWVTRRWEREARASGFPDARLMGLNAVSDELRLPRVALEASLAVSTRLPPSWSLHAALIGHYLD